MKYNNFNRESEIQKQKELYEKERECYEQAVKNNPNHKIVYYTKYHHL